jgi:hypothetical protein
VDLIRTKRGQLCQIHSVDERLVKTRFHFLERIEPCAVQPVSSETRIAD